jgi:predicted regulator of Ras-like GTPase activity (Roadblock/LC7/MglB family)
MSGHAGDSGMDPLKQALAEYLKIPGIRAAFLISDQGLLVSSMAREGVDTASIAALAVDTVASAQRFGQQVRAGQLDTMSIEFQNLTVVFAPFTPDVMLGLLALPGSVGILLGKLSGPRVGSATPEAPGASASSPTPPSVPSPAPPATPPTT